MKKAILFIPLFFLALSAFCQKDSVHSHARQLLQLTGSGKLGIQMMDNMIASFKKEMQSVPAEFWDEFTKEVNADELIELVVPVYAKYYSDAELLRLIEFYKTPLGQKVIEKTPFIAQESYFAGQEWGKKIGEKTVAKLIAAGYMKEG
jgi:uncharacterized protein